MGKGEVLGIGIISEFFQSWREILVIRRVKDKRKRKADRFCSTFKHL